MEHLAFADQIAENDGYSYFTTSSLGISPLLTCAFPRYSQRIARTLANRKSGSRHRFPQSPGAYHGSTVTAGNGRSAPVSLYGYATPQATPRLLSVPHRSILKVRNAAGTKSYPAREAEPTRSSCGPRLNADSVTCRVVAHRPEFDAPATGLVGGALEPFAGKPKKRRAGPGCRYKPAAPKWKPGLRDVDTTFRGSSWSA